MAEITFRVSRGSLLILAAFILSLIIVPRDEAYGQKNADSPVFRSYKPPEDLPLLRKADPTFQSWQAFLATRKANAGDPVAQQELALRYFTGVGVDADTAKAAFWMKKAADQNLVQARFNMALFCYHGWGVPWDPFESYHQFLLCAERHIPEAEYAVGIFSIENLIMPEDWQQGYTWVKRAADAGYRPAIDVLKSFEQRLAMQQADSLVFRAVPPALTISPEDTGSVAPSEAALRDALRRADPETRKALGMSRLLDQEINADSLDVSAISASAEAGSPEALALLGRCHQEGIGVARDQLLAAVYYFRAVRMESARAGQLLWEMAQSGNLVSQMKKRAEAGDRVGYYLWAGLLSLGFEGPLVKAKAFITPEQAVLFLAKSADAGFIPAMIELGLWYYSGRGVPRDEAHAIALWHDAEKRGSKEAALRLAVTDVRRDTSREGLEHAVALLREASQKGAVLADVALGYCFEHGIVMAKSSSEAAELYRSAWRRGSQDAYRALRRMHDAIRPPDKEFAMRD